MQDAAGPFLRNSAECYGMSRGMALTFTVIIPASFPCLSLGNCARPCGNVRLKALRFHHPRWPVLVKPLGYVEKLAVLKREETSPIPIPLSHTRKAPSGVYYSAVYFQHLWITTWLLTLPRYVASQQALKPFHRTTFTQMIRFREDLTCRDFVSSPYRP